MKQNRQFVRVNSDFINKDLSAGAVKVLFLLASIAQAGGSDTAVISNARIAERTKLTIYKSKTCFNYLKTLTEKRIIILSVI